jgi:hypothetical protein
MTIDDVVTMLLAEAIREYACTWRPCSRYVSEAILLSSARALSVGANAETQRRAVRAGWVYR